MAIRTIIYGDILNKKDRQKIETDHQKHLENLLWQTEAVLFESTDNPSLVFVDLDNPLFSSPEFLVSIATAGKDIKVIGKLQKPTMDETLQMAKMGVSEILNPSQCLRKLDKFLNDLETVKEDTDEPKTSKYSIDALHGESRQIAEIRHTIGLLTDVDFPSALILGETGVGKSLVAKILHNSGTRSNYNMVEVNCSAIPDELFESELFGHAKGAFTDAKTEKMGLFEYAENGTLFLDEVGNLSPSAQGKLLKILEDKKLRKIGNIVENDINVRVVAATNIDLDKAVEVGKFRDDLYFRLNLLTIEVPPLRERPEDIPGIVNHYINFYATIYGKPNLSISEPAVIEMQKHDWAGNVRELCNVLERAILLTRKKTIGIKDIINASKKGRINAQERQQIIIELPPQGMSLQEMEQELVKQVLDFCNWNKTETAKFLNISRPRLRRIIENSGMKQNRRNG